MMDAVVKIGGRLGRGKHLRAVCEGVATLGKSRRLLIVPGGGVFADAVRRCETRVRLSDTAAHWMAILAMDQYGYLLADLIPGSTAVRSLEEAHGVAAEGRAPVLLPFDLVHRVDALPHSWTVTADSIAVWVAGLVEAPTLVLLKDGKGFNSPIGLLKNGASSRECAGYAQGKDAGSARSSERMVTLEQLAGWEGVDGYCSQLLRGAGFDLWILNGERPECLTELLATGRTEGIHMPRSDASDSVPRPRPPGRSGDLLGTPQSGRR